MTTFDISRVHFNTDEAETFAFKRFILTFQCVIADSFNADWVPTLNIGHNKKTDHTDWDQAAKRSERVRECELVKKPAFAKRAEERESEREKRLFKVNKSGHHILALNFKVSEAESLENPTEKGTQTDSRMFVDVGTQSEEYVYLVSPPNVKPPFDQCELEKDNEKVKFYTGLLHSKY